MVQQILIMVGAGACYMLIGYLYTYINKKTSDWFARQKGYDIDHAIEEDSNLAVALRRVGLYLGTGIGMFGVVSGPSVNFGTDLISIVTYGAFISVLFIAARVFNDAVILSSIDNTKQVHNRNVAVGLVECGGYLATGIIAMASVTGSGGGLHTALAFFLLGQLLLLAVTLVYELVTSWSMKDEIAAGNPAAGLLLGGTMVAVAVAIHGAVAIDFSGWVYNLTILAIEGGLAIVFMLIVASLADRFFLPNTDLKTEVVRDQNVAAVSIVVAMKLFGALMITAAIA